MHSHEMKRAAWSFLLLATFCNLFAQALSHGYLADPPGRSSAWRFGFGTAISYNDHQVTCGRVEKSQCGICGDPLYQIPGDHTLGGKYGTGVIVKTYEMGQIIKTKVKITANHRGWFEFSICRVVEGGSVAEDCFQPLTTVDAGRRPKYAAEKETKWQLLARDGINTFEVQVRLPDGLTCDHCVLRWLWNAGNDWGCEGRKCRMGLGKRQEKFYSCADIAVRDGEVVKESCANASDGETISDLTNCCGFLRCEGNAARRHSCPDGTAWNEEQGECENGIRVNCGKRNDSCLLSKEPEMPTPKVCTRGLHGAHLPHPNNCCAFIRCVAGAEVEMKCPPKLAFNAMTDVCDWPINVYCGTRSDDCLN